MASERSDPGPGFRRALQHRRWRWLLGSYAISTTGDFLYSVALIVFLIESTGSPTWIAASVVVRMLAYILLSPAAGVVADRYDRRRLLIVLDLVRAALMLVLAAIAWTDSPPALAIAVMVFSSAASAPYRPAAIAATPLLVAEDDLAAANAAESVVSQLGYFIGPALGAALIGLTDTGIAFALNGLTFAVSGLLLVRVGDIGGGRRRTVPDQEGDPDPRPGASADDEGGFAEGVAVVRHEQGLAPLIGFIAMSVVVLGFEEVAHVLVAEDRLGLDPAGVGWLAAATAMGGLLIAPFTARLAAGRRLGTVLVVAGVLSGVPVGLLALTRSPVLAALFLAIEGMGIIVFEVVSLTMLQRACREAVLGRVYGLVDASAAAGQLVGSLSAPILVGALSLEAGLWIIGLSMAGVSLLALPSMWSLAARTDAERARLAPLVARLGSLPAFTDVPRPSLERLARQARPLTVPANSSVVAEGGPSDHVFVVEAGELAVSTVADGEVNRMGPDDVFGEIGIVRGIPRTATVIATTDVALLEIDGADFLDAVTGSGPVPDPLRRMISSRLGRTHPWLEADRA